LIGLEDCLEKLHKEGLHKCLFNAAAYLRTLLIGDYGFRPHLDSER